ncbi:hypothetical protein HC761_00915 [bacterium]|nr:hypothetical protein [bacterium]
MTQPSTASAVKAARTARAAGCAAVCCLPPFFFPSSERSRIEHYKAVADAADGDGLVGRRIDNDEVLDADGRHQGPLTVHVEARAVLEHGIAARVISLSVLLGDRPQRGP